MAHIPKLRFNGFTEEWEQRKLVDIVGSVIGGGTPKTSNDEYWDGDIPWIQSSNVQENEIFDFEIPKRITQAGLDKSAAKLVPENSIAVVTHVGVGKLVFVPFTYTTSQDFTSLAELKTDPYFTCYSLYKRIQEDLHIVQGSAIKGITKDDLLTKEIVVPEKDEQYKIGKYFRSIDNLITLYQRKCNSLKQVKKYMLQKMFPKQGEKVPEIRFAGFTGDWEQRKLGDITQRVQSNDGRMNLPTLTISAVNGWMNQVDRFSGNIAGKEQKNYTLLRRGELSYNHGNSKLAKYGTVFALQSFNEALVPRVYHSFKMINGNSDFIEYYFSTKILDKELAKLISSGARMDGLLNISYDDFMGIKVNVPSVEEQNRISDYLRKIDSLIALHQRKVDSLKEIKKFMLQNMFP